MQVCMLVRNTCTHDARVIKEARTLAASGHNVTVIALKSTEAPSTENRDGFIIKRVPVRPLHYLLFRKSSSKPTSDNKRTPVIETPRFPKWAKFLYKKIPLLTFWPHQLLLMQDYFIRSIFVASKIKPDVIH